MLSSPHGNLVKVSDFTISSSSAPLASDNHGFASFPTTVFGVAPFLAGHSTLQTGSAVAPACSGPGPVDIKHCYSFFLPDVTFSTLCSQNEVESSPVIHLVVNL